MKLSRIKTRVSLLLTLTGAAGVIVGAIYYKALLSIIGLLLLMVGSIMLLLTNRCPDCGFSIRELFWSKPHAGYCRNCGKKIEYDR